MEPIHGFNFIKLDFDAKGALEKQAQLDELLREAANATDVVFIAHGFRNNEQDATGWYTKFLETFQANAAREEFKNNLDQRKWLVAGVYWPSKALPEGPSGDGTAQSLDDETVQEQIIRAQLDDLKSSLADAGAKAKVEEAIALLPQLGNDNAAQNQFVDKLLSVAQGESADENEGLTFIRSLDGTEVLDRLSARRRRRQVETADEGSGMAVAAAPAPSDEEGATQGLGTFFGGLFGKVGKLINLTTWYVMKDRAGLVGLNGCAKAVRELKKKHPNVRVHLVGHSLGGRLMAACAKALGESPIAQPDSLTLLQAAFSHYGFSKAKEKRGEGFFRVVMEKRVVKGPLVATFSSLDSVVGTVYSTASMLARDNTQKFGDKNSQFGGIGANGAQDMDAAEVLTETLHAAGTPYPNMAKTGLVLCLDGSDNLITSHGDITNPNVTYAFASAVART